MDGSQFEINKRCGKCCFLGCYGAWKANNLLTFWPTLQGNAIKAEDRSEMSVKFLLGYTAPHFRRRHSTANVI
jgi:hypothetical protein